MTVLLVDGVGTAVGYERHADVLTIAYRPPGFRSPLRFEKVAGTYGGCDVYRLRGCGTPTIRDGRLTRPVAA
jgi:hypothetical protein